MLYQELRWRLIGPFRGGRSVAISGIQSQPNVFFMAANNGGVWRTTDYGRTWNPIFDDQPTGSIGALAIAPSNPDVIYVGSGEGLRRPDLSTGDGIYKSLDGGRTWKHLGLRDGQQTGGIIVDPHDPNRVFAGVLGHHYGPNAERGVFRSLDGGATWKKVLYKDENTGAINLEFDPANSQIIYADMWASRRPPWTAGNSYSGPGSGLYKSTDGGSTWRQLTKGLPTWNNPQNPQIIALAVDQGVVISVNGGETWSSWYNQPTAQFYHVITDNQFPYWVYGGQQESGSIGIASRSDFGEITFRDWYPVGVEEYGYVAPDPLDPNIIYGGKATRFNRVTGQTQDVSPVILRTGKYRFNRTAPLIFSPVDPHTLYLGSNVLFKTTDGGNNWQLISPDLTRGDPGVPLSFGVFAESDKDKGKHRGVIYSLAPSPKDVNLIWAGTDDGLIHVTHDGGKTWQNVTPPDLTPWSKLAQMDASHFDAATAYAAVNRFRLDDLHPYIYRTHDRGKSWTKIVSGIPDDEPVNTVREDPERKGLLFAGTERTLYVSFDDGDHWQSLRLNLPATSIRDLIIHGDDIVVGTHGRSFWILDNITPLRQVNSEAVGADVYFFAPQSTYRMRRDNNTDTPLPTEEPAGKNPPDGAKLDYFLSSADNELDIEIVDSTGKVVRKFSSADKPEAVDEKELNIPTYWIRPQQILSTAPGMHRFVWDLHYSAPESVTHEYPISAIYRDTPRSPLGPAVLPGSYTVEITVNGKSYTQPLTVKMDPRVKASEDDLRRQFEF